MELKPVAPLESTVWNSMQGVLNAIAKGVRLKDKSHPCARFVLSILALALASLPAAPAWADGGMGGAASGGGGVTVFADSSTGGNAQIVNEIGGASVFSDTSSAGSASIVNQAGGLCLRNSKCKP